MQLEEVGNKLSLKIKEIKDKGSKIIITFFDDSKLKISRPTFNNFIIVEGKELDAKTKKDIERFEEKEEIRKYIKVLVNKKPYTERELLKKAIGKFNDYHLVIEVVKELKVSHLIDDEEFVDNYLDYFDKNNYGQYFIINFFRSSGLKEELIKKLDFDEENEKRKALNYFDSIKNKFVSNNFAKQKKKIYDRMLQRGFNITVILDVLNNLKINEESEKERLRKDFKKAKMKYFITNDNQVDANSKIVNKLINKGYSLEDINEIIESDEDFDETKEKLND